MNIAQYKTLIQNKLEEYFNEYSKVTESNSKIIVYNLKIDLGKYKVYIGNKEVLMSKKEFETIKLFAQNPDRIFTRDNLLDAIWGIDQNGSMQTVDSHIKRLRKKINACNHPNWEIKTIWGVGYKLHIIQQVQNPTR